MNYKLINYIKTDKWEGMTIEDEKGIQYYTNGVIRWKITPERINKVKIVESINLDEFKKYWNRNFINSSIN
jgi:hypothetical protein